MENKVSHSDMNNASTLTKVFIFPAYNYKINDDKYTDSQHYDNSDEDNNGEDVLVVDLIGHNTQSSVSAPTLWWRAAAGGTFDQDS